MSAPPVIYALNDPTFAVWASRCAPAGAVVVASVDARDAQPHGTVWLCSPSTESGLRAARGADTIVALRPFDAAPWSQLAHDLRGPAGVVGGALDELESEDPLLALAKRGVRQIVHMAECWSLLGHSDISSSRVVLSVAIASAMATFGELEPRRKTRVEPAASGNVAAHTDAQRLELGLVRTLAHLVRAVRGPIRVHAPADSVIEFALGESVAAPGPTSALWAQSSRLATAAALVEPIIERWEASDVGIRWRLRTLDA